MTKGQLKRLDTIIAKLEALQQDADDRAGLLARAKSLLLEAYSKGIQQ